MTSNKESFVYSYGDMVVLDILFSIWLQNTLLNMLQDISIVSIVTYGDFLKKFVIVIQICSKKVLTVDFIAIVCFLMGGMCVCIEVTYNTSFS